MARSRHLVLVGIIGIIGASCTSNVEIAVPSLPFVADDGSSGGDGALLSGLLVIDGVCVYIDDDNGARHLPVFEAGAASFSELGLKYDGSTTAAGERISLAGSIASKAGLTFESGPDGACDASLIWLATS